MLNTKEFISQAVESGLTLFISNQVLKHVGPNGEVRRFYSIISSNRRAIMEYLQDKDALEELRLNSEIVPKFSPSGYPLEEREVLSFSLTSKEESQASNNLIEIIDEFLKRGCLFFIEYETLVCDSPRGYLTFDDRKKLGLWANEMAKAFRWLEKVRRRDMYRLVLKKWIKILEKSPAFSLVIDGHEVKDVLSIARKLEGAIITDSYKETSIKSFLETLEAKCSI